MIDVSTPGEALFLFVKKTFFPDQSVSVLENLFTFTREEQSWAWYASECAIIGLTAKLVLVGDSLREEAGGDDSYKSALEKAIQLDLGIPHRRIVADLVRLTDEAVRARKRDINDRTRKYMTSWARRCHPACYLCGVPLVFPSTELAKQLPAAITIDHIWPSSIGGSSDEANLLPACSHCNHTRKKAYATWSMVDIQSLVLPPKPSDNDLSSIAGRHRVALHQKAVVAYADARSISLKQSCKELGPWTDVTLGDFCLAHDFFSLSNTNTRR